MLSTSTDTPNLNLDTRGTLAVNLASHTPNPWGMKSEYLLGRRLSKPKRQYRYCRTEQNFLLLQGTKHQVHGHPAHQGAIPDLMLIRNYANLMYPNNDQKLLPSLGISVTGHKSCPT